ncbi:CBR-GUR-5 protein [Ditylenchus destructor]|uniref:CBR-GUR-5 protein n=1 Tax=Ditylenchus destructor TaxID=166010 RepID=A0AAD4N2R1_9BILA|nr:CBR-GUR-5 protein [Ditylenchus destructor]
MTVDMLIRMIKLANGSLETINAERIYSLGWLVQSTLAMAFIVQWQRQGAIQYIDEHLLIPVSTHCPMYRKLNRTRVIFAIIAFVSSAFTATNIIYNVYRIAHSYSINPDLSKLPYSVEKIIRSILMIHGPYVWNISLCLFVVVVKSVTIELQQFNKDFKVMLKNSECMAVNDQRDHLCESLLHSFAKHNGLAEKIIHIDRTFRFLVYTFAMTTVGGATTIFAMLSLIRTEVFNVYLLFSIHDTACCYYHLFGLCVVPAQVYTEFRALQGQLYRQSAIWTNYDLKVYQIAGMLTENVAQSNIGITLWGFTLITKSLILTCLSLLIPYVMLCLQLQIGSRENDPYRSVNGTIT